MPSLLLIGIATFATLFSLTYGLLLWLENRRAVRARLKSGGAAGLPLYHREAKQNSFLKQVLEWLSSFGRLAVKDQEEVSKVRASLIHAGFRNPRGPAVYFGLRALSAMLLPLPYALSVLMTGKWTLGSLGLLLLLGGVGFYLPQVGLNFIRHRRQDRMDKALPDVLDLLIVCMEAGLGLQATLNRVAEEIKPISKDLFFELQITNAELRTGIPRDVALKNLGERTGVQNIKSLVGMMIQSDKMGASIAQAFRTHAAFLRVQRGQKAEEKAAKLPVKILIPMLIFIFPAVFIVILGPAVIQITRSTLFKF
ncbi:MAG: type II secretion system F family protein [Deltaproteobacteria bacterium]|nr:type II secretion system F family protein [Deltaproteobacteria bacterium]